MSSVQATRLKKGNLINMDGALLRVIELHHITPGNKRGHVLCKLRDIRTSRLVVTISEHAARAVIERYELPEERVRPIHLGLDHEVFNPDGAARERFLVYPARAWPHKNHERLFAAFAELRRRDPDLELPRRGRLARDHR